MSLLNLFHDRFCIECGVWFSDALITCPNCNAVKVESAATRLHQSTRSEELQQLIQMIKRDLGITK